MAQDTNFDDVPRKLACPKCAAPMETVRFQDIEIDRCTGCKGLWFDALEREHLAGLKGSERVDVGSLAASGSSAIKTLNCPVCHTQMIKMVDHSQPSVHYESCQVCYGLFFDAGEFRQLNESHVMDFFHRLFHPDVD